MLSLTIQAATLEELKKKALEFGTGGGVPALTGERFALGPMTDAKPQTVAAKPAEAKPDARPRGRPRKETVSPQAAPAAAPEMGNPASQAQVDNSASADSGAPPEQPASSPAGSAASPAAASAGGVSFEDMKSKLQAVAVKRDGDKDDNDGLIRASAIIGKYGYRKIKEVLPEHFAAIAADCDKALAA